MVGVFKRNHPEIYGIDDIGKMMFGKAGHAFLGTAFCLCESSMMKTTRRLCDGFYSSDEQIGFSFLGLVC